MVVGRGSSIEAYPLFGYDLADYDSFSTRPTSPGRATIGRH